MAQNSSHFFTGNFNVSNGLNFMIKGMSKWLMIQFKEVLQISSHFFSVDTGHILNGHKTFRIPPGRLRNALCTFNSRPVSAGFILAKVCSSNLIKPAMADTFKRAWFKYGMLPPRNSLQGSFSRICVVSEGSL